MIDADRAEFAKVMLGMQEIYGQKLSRAAIELYWAALADWTLDAFQAAAAQLLRTSRFLPRPADFAELRKAAAGQNADTAWDELIHAHGECSDAVGARALRSLGGWRVVGFADMDRLPWLKERFREAYGNFQATAEARVAIPGAPTRPCLDGPRSIQEIGLIPPA